MSRFMANIAFLGAIIAAIARLVYDDGKAIAKIALAHTAKASAAGADWLATKLDAAAKRIDRTRFVAQ